MTTRVAVDDVEANFSRPEPNGDAAARTAQHPLREIAAAEIRGRLTEEETARLRSPGWLEAWIEALVELNADIEAQFAERKAKAQKVQNECMALGRDGKQEWFDYKADYDAWRAGARRFKASVSGRINEAKRLRHERSRTDQLGELRRLLNQTRSFLRDEENIAYGAMPRRDKLLEEIAEFFRESHNR